MNRAALGRSLLFLAAGGWSAPGCGGEDPGASTERRDSAGIAIVEASAGARPAAGEAGRPVVDPRPAIDIGAMDGPEPYQLYRAGSAVRLADGRIVIANGGTSELRFYDDAGRHLGSVGRRGEGPGEFEDLQRVWRLPGDSLLAYDFFPGRLSVFTPAGEYVRTIQVRAPDGRQVLVRGPFDDGSLLAWGAPIWGAAGAEPGIVRDSVPYYRFARDGALTDTLGWFPSSETYRFATDQGWRLTSPAFPRNPVAAVGPDRFHFGPADRYEIRTYTAAGELERVLRLERAARPVRSVDIERYRARRLGETDGPARAATERLLRDMPYPQEMPAYQAIQAGPEGELWVADYRADPEEDRTWRVFAPAGDYLGVVTMPPALELFQIGPDFVLGRWRDELEVEHIRLHRLTR